MKTYYVYLTDQNSITVQAECIDMTDNGALCVQDDLYRTTHFFAPKEWVRFEIVPASHAPTPCADAGSYAISGNALFDACPVKDCYHGTLTQRWPDADYPETRECRMCFGTGTVPTDAGADMLQLLGTVFASECPPLITQRIRVRSAVQRLRVIRDTAKAMGDKPDDGVPF